AAFHPHWDHAIKSKNLLVCFLVLFGEWNPEIDSNVVLGEAHLFNDLDQDGRPFGLDRQTPTQLGWNVGQSRAYPARNWERPRPCALSIITGRSQKMFWSSPMHRAYSRETMGSASVCSSYGPNP